MEGVEREVERWS